MHTHAKPTPTIKEFMQRTALTAAPRDTQTETTTLDRAEPETQSNGNYESRWQNASLYTMRVWYKDGNKRSFHSWRQEIFVKADKVKRVDHLYAYKRMKDIIMSKETYYKHRCIHVYCNLTGDIVLKSVFGKVKELATLIHHADEKGNYFLQSIETASQKKTVYKDAVEHARRNFAFVKHNG